MPWKAVRDCEIIVVFVGCPRQPQVCVSLSSPRMYCEESGSCHLLPILLWLASADFAANEEDTMVWSAFGSAWLSSTHLDKMTANIPRTIHVGLRRRHWMCCVYNNSIAISGYPLRWQFNQQPATPISTTQFEVCNFFVTSLHQLQRWSPHFATRCVDVGLSLPLTRLWLLHCI
jgi:hypothetical protein